MSPFASPTTSGHSSSEFPRFMDGVESVKRLDRSTLEWVATIAGRRRTWRVRVLEQTPDVRIAWQRIDGGASDGTVLFRPLGLDRTLVTLRLEVEPDGPMEALGAPDGFLERQVRGNLRQFKDLVEEQLVPPGPWRGGVDPGEPSTARRSDRSRPESRPAIECNSD